MYHFTIEVWHTTFLLILYTTYMNNVFENPMVQKTSLIVLGVIGLLILLNVSGSFFRMHEDKPREWMEHSFGGVIVESTPSSLSVKNVHGDIKVFQLSDTTSIRQGRDTVTLEALTPGRYVIVNGQPYEGADIALSVRLFSKEGEVIPPAKYK